MSLRPLDIDEAALLVVDMQNAFCHPEGTLGISGVDTGPAHRIIGPIRTVVEAFRAAGRPVIWTVQVHLDPDASRARKHLAAHTDKRARVSARSGTWDAQLVDELAPLADDPTYVVTKHRFGAFHQTRLDTLLGMLGVRSLFVTGATANACIETSIREAYLRDYDVVAMTDCIAAVRQEWAKPAHAVWAQYFGVLAESAEVLDWLKEADAPRAERLHHLLLEAGDLAAAERFYVDLLGLTVRKRDTHRDGRPLLLTENGIGLTTGRSGGSVDHIAFRTRHIDALTERARAAGVTVVRGPGPGPYGHTVYLADPDGNEVELIESGEGTA